VQAAERAVDAIQRLRLHLHQRKIDIFLRRVVRQVGRRAGRVAALGIPESANLLLDLHLNGAAALFQHRFQLGMS
jgi:hypothetical protein